MKGCYSEKQGTELLVMCFWVYLAFFSPFNLYTIYLSNSDIGPVFEDVQYYQFPII